MGTTATRLVPARQVLDAIQRNCEGIVELRALPLRGQVFAARDDLTALQRFVATHRDTQNLYWAVATRKDATSGRTENCRQLGSLFADLDFSKHSEAHLRARLERFPLPPSVVIHSGGGLHVYFILASPLDVDGVREATPAGGMVKSLLRRLALALDGDLVVAEAARVLRIPDTFNLKRDTPARVRLETFAPDRCYPIEQIAAVLPHEPAPVIVRTPRTLRLLATRESRDRCERGRAYLAAMGAAVEGQAGDSHTYRAACWLVNDLDLSDGEALDLLCEWNRSCVPPWTEGELLAKVAHARRYGLHPPGAALTSVSSSSFVTVRVRVPQSHV